MDMSSLPNPPASAGWDVSHFGEASASSPTPPPDTGTHHYYSFSTEASIITTTPSPPGDPQFDAEACCLSLMTSAGESTCGTGSGVWKDRALDAVFGAALALVKLGKDHKEKTAARERMERDGDLSVASIENLTKLNKMLLGSVAGNIFLARSPPEQLMKLSCALLKSTWKEYQSRCDSGKRTTTVVAQLQERLEEEERQQQSITEDKEEYDKGEPPGPGTTTGTDGEDTGVDTSNTNTQNEEETPSVAHQGTKTSMRSSSSSAVEGKEKRTVDGDYEELLIGSLFCMKMATNRFDDTVTAAMKDGIFDILKVLVLSNDNSQMTQLASLQVIGNFASGDDVQTEVVLQFFEENSEFFASLYAHPRMEFRREACFITSNLTALPPREVLRTVRQGWIHKMVRAVYPPYNASYSKAAKVLGRCCRPNQSEEEMCACTQELFALADEADKDVFITIVRFLLGPSIASSMGEDSIPCSQQYQCRLCALALSRIFALGEKRSEEKGLLLNGNALAVLESLSSSSATWPVQAMQSPAFLEHCVVFPRVVLRCTFDSLDDDESDVEGSATSLLLPCDVQEYLATFMPAEPFNQYYKPQEAAELLHQYGGGADPEELLAPKKTEEESVAFGLPFPGELLFLEDSWGASGSIRSTGSPTGAAVEHRRDAGTDDRVEAPPSSGALIPPQLLVGLLWAVDKKRDISVIREMCFVLANVLDGREPECLRYFLEHCGGWGLLLDLRIAFQNNDPSTCAVVDEALSPLIEIFGEEEEQEGEENELEKYVREPLRREGPCRHASLFVEGLDWWD